MEESITFKVTPDKVCIHKYQSTTCLYVVESYILNESRGTFYVYIINTSNYIYII